jgi:hypothetical protein
MTAGSNVDIGTISLAAAAKMLGGEVTNGPGTFARSPITVGEA